MKNNINKKLYDWRKSKKLSYEKAASFLGIPIATYWRIECMAGYETRLSHAHLIVKKTGLTYPDLLPKNVSQLK